LAALAFRSRCLRTRNRQDEIIAAQADPVAHALGYEIVRIRVLSGKRQTVQIMVVRG